MVSQVVGEKKSGDRCGIEWWVAIYWETLKSSVWRMILSGNQNTGHIFPHLLTMDTLLFSISYYISPQRTA